MNRREMIKLSSLAGAGAGVHQAFAFSPPDSGSSLQSAASKGTLIGVAISKKQLDAGQITDFVTKNFGLITPGHEFYWSTLRPGPDSYNFSDADWMVSFAASHNMKVHGHNLCWDQALPSWFNKTLTAANALKYLTDHITKVVGRYKGRIESWDVVNEPVRTANNKPDGLTDSIWLRLCGSSYIDAAFHAAAVADPSAVRVLNQDGLELENDTGTKTRAATLKLVQGMLQRGVPIQAIGMESHLNGSNSMNSPGRNQFIKAIRGLGLQILITELDINDTHIQGSDEDREKAVAGAYYQFLIDILPASGANRVIFWSPTDLDNWYDRLDAAKASSQVAGSAHHPGLLNSGMAPAPAYWAVQAALKHVKDLPG